MTVLNRIYISRFGWLQPKNLDFDVVYVLQNWPFPFRLQVKKVGTATLPAPTYQSYLEHSFGDPLDQVGLALGERDVGHNLRLQILEVGIHAQVL